MTEETKDIISRLKEAIDKSGMSYVELENRTGIPKSSIQRYASGKTKKVPIDAIQLIARAVGTSPTVSARRPFSKGRFFFALNPPKTASLLHKSANCLHCFRCQKVLVNINSYQQIYTENTQLKNKNYLKN